MTRTNTSGREVPSINMEVRDARPRQPNDNDSLHGLVPSLKRSSSGARHVSSEQDRDATQSMQQAN